MTDGEYIKRLGIKVSKLRNQAKLTQEELVKKTKISRTTLYRIENGMTLNCSIIDLRKISKALKIELADLVDVLK